MSSLLKTISQAQLENYNLNGLNLIFLSSLFFNQNSIFISSFLSGVEHIYIKLIHQLLSESERAIGLKV